MADDCKHPRGEGRCPNCGVPLVHQQVFPSKPLDDLRSFMRVASVLFPWGSEAQKWVERKIAEENNGK